MIYGEDNDARLDIARAYKAHLDHIRADRNLEEHLQSLSPLEAGNPIFIHLESWT